MERFFHMHALINLWPYRRLKRFWYFFYFVFIRCLVLLTTFRLSWVCYNCILSIGHFTLKSLWCCIGLQSTTLPISRPFRVLELAGAVCGETETSRPLSDGYALTTPPPFTPNPGFLLRKPIILAKISPI